MRTASRLFSEPALLSIGMALAISASLLAQRSAGISGKVTDPTGASVPGATVTVKSTETGATRVTSTDEGGNFRADAVSLGPQEIRVEKTGFKAAVRTGIDLAVGQDAVVKELCCNSARKSSMCSTGPTSVRRMLWCLAAPHTALPQG